MTARTAHPLWPDTPAERDLLGFADIAVPLVDAIRRERLDPVTLGVFGTWGSGKSTILDLMAKSLRKDEVVIRVRPWEFERHEDVKTILIGEVLQQLQTRLSERGVAERAKETLQKLIVRINWAKAVSIAARAALLQLPSVEDALGLLGPDRGKQDASLPEFRREFSEFLKTLDLSRVVVLVDDLDRCLPPAVIATLEAIKLFLSVPKMSFVIAADERSVTLAIESQYERAPEEARVALARQYLEKIVHIPMRVPSLGVAETECYLAMMLVQDKIDEAQFEAIVIATAEQRSKGGAGLVIDPETARSLRSELDLARTLAPILARHLEGNPRRLKRFLNAYWLRSAIADLRGITFDPPVLAKLMVLEEIYPVVFDELVKRIDTGDLGSHLKDLEQGAAGDETARGWASLPPPLAEIDLVPYLRLAASLRQTVTGSVNLSAAAQAAFDSITVPGAAARRAARGAVVALLPVDRAQVARALAARIARSPREQGNLGPELVAICQDDLTAKAAADELAQMPASVVEPGFIVLLVEPAVPEPLRALKSPWLNDPSLPPATKKAHEQIMRIKK